MKTAIAMLLAVAGTGTMLGGQAAAQDQALLDARRLPDERAGRLRQLPQHRAPRTCRLSPARSSPAASTSFDPIGFDAYAANITPDPETGIGTWTDEEIITAIREGKTKEGRIIFPPMPVPTYNNMSDDDVKAIVAYLRTVQADPQRGAGIEVQDSAAGDAAGQGRAGAADRATRSPMAATS